MVLATFKNCAHYAEKPGRKKGVWFVKLEAVAG